MNVPRIFAISFPVLDKDQYGNSSNMAGIAISGNGLPPELSSISIADQERLTQEYASKVLKIFQKHSIQAIISEIAGAGNSCYTGAKLRRLIFVEGYENQTLMFLDSILTITDEMMHQAGMITTPFGEATSQINKNENFDFDKKIRNFKPNKSNNINLKVDGLPTIKLGNN